MACKFTIITVSYNSRLTIEQTIQSVLSQSYKKFEYIIVDGASTDGTVDILKKYAEKDSRIRYISESDNGVYEAMNKGIQLATGDVIGLINSNDYYEPHALQTIAENIPEDKWYVVYGMTRFLKDEKEIKVLFHNHIGLPDRMIMHPSSFVSKAVYQEYQYDTQYKAAADYDLFIKLYKDARVVFIPVYKIIATFRLGGISSDLISHLETNDVRYRHGYISKRTRFWGNLGMRIKWRLLRGN